MKSRVEWKYIFRIMREFSKNCKWVCSKSFVLGVFGAVTPYISIVLMGYLLDAVKAGVAVETLLKYAGVALGAVMIIKLAEAFIRETFNAKNEFIKELEARALNEKSLGMDYEYLEDTSVQALRYKAQAEGNYIGTVGWLLARIERLTRAVLSIVFALCIMIPLLLSSGRGKGFICSWWAAILLFVILGLCVYASYKYSSDCVESSKAESDKLTEFYTRKNYYLDKLASVEASKDLRIYAQQSVIEADADKADEGAIAGRRRVAKIRVRRDWMGALTSSLSSLLVYLFTGFRAYAGVISVGGVVTYASSILKFSQGVADFALFITDLKQVSMYCKDYCTYLDMKDREEGSKELAAREDGTYEIEFNNVYFRYPGTEEDIINNLSMKFTIGGKMAIVGKNGSGKTTFIKLLCRMYDVTGGQILVNGTDIRQIDYADYCRLFAIVFQDFRVFSFKVGENVAAGENVDEERAMDALKKAGMEERIKTLPMGLDTYVGKDFMEEGIAFSGGEKQKTAIARAIYKDAAFVIMDEPTAALDPVSECEVFAGFDRMVGNKTALYISHRLASCRFCEDILVFDKGCIVQRGSHEQLVEEDGLYRQLWNAQAQYYAATK